MALINNKADHIVVVTDLFTGKVITLNPGINDLDNAVWGNIRSQLKDKIDTGLIKEHGIQVADKDVAVPATMNQDTPPQQEIKQAVAFGKLAIGDAAEMVGQTFDLDQLAKWRDAETRESVRSAIIAQIEKINAGKSN